MLSVSWAETNGSNINQPLVRLSRGSCVSIIFHLLIFQEDALIGPGIYHLLSYANDIIFTSSRGIQKRDRIPGP